MSDNNNTNKLIEELSRKLGVSEKQLENAAKKGNVKDVLKNMDAKSSQQIESILSDPEKTREILNSPQAQALMKLFGGN
jgi:hypothetical protein